MRIAIATPELAVAQHGNRVTARRWAVILQSLGHVVAFGDGADADLAVAEGAAASTPPAAPSPR